MEQTEQNDVNHIFFVALIYQIEHFLYIGSSKIK